MKILIIEDDPEIAALEQDYLNINGYETHIAPSGSRGILALREGGYDLVILDVMLPGMDGFEVLRIVREEWELPVIMLSARGEDIDKIRGLGLGADDYMQKPFSPGELVARVGAHLSRYARLSGRDAKQQPAIRGLKVDKDARRVFLHEAEKNLTNKEFDLLVYLMQNPNRVFSKDELFDRVWGLDAIGDSSTVVVHIKKLREKIEPDVANPQFIETVWGAGYRFRI